jgi:hypothetical protein
VTTNLTRSINLQLAKARAGEEARFIDRHMTQHLDWHAGLKAELREAAQKAGIRQPSSTLLGSMARELSDDRHNDGPPPLHR